MGWGPDLGDFIRLRTTRLQVAGVGEAAVDHLGEGVEGVAGVECVERCRAVDALKLLAF